ncbi:MAG: pyridoxamine 5'-phosphate oxidase family protein [Xanthomonadales bacterium]|nr:pyridoxamine 5'-phosphate oxidase family protein [Xanthomonadales bacterium]
MHEHNQKFTELLAEFDTAMLVTRSLGQQLRARPMALASHGRDDGVLWFASRAEDEKLEEIRAAPDVAVTMQAAGRYLSVTGRARIENNETLAGELWSPSMKLWFPDGPGDPHLALIAVEPLLGEYWDRRGALRLEFLWEAGKALVRGEKLDDDRLSGHAKLRPEGR